MVDWLDTERAETVPVLTTRSFFDPDDGGRGVTIVVTNSDLAISGPMLTAKHALTSRDAWDFPGRCSLALNYGSNAEVGKTGQLKEYASCIDVATAARVFSDVKLVVERLESSRAGLKKEWEALNGGAARRGLREERCRVFTLATKHWTEGIGSRAKDHHTELIIELSTYAATHKYQRTQSRVFLAEDDIFVFVKYRSTKFAHDPDQPLGYDKNGLYVPFPSFIKLLGSAAFQRAVEDAACRSANLAQPAHLQSDAAEQREQQFERDGRREIIDRFMAGQPAAESPPRPATSAGKGEPEKKKKNRGKLPTARDEDLHNPVLPTQWSPPKSKAADGGKTRQVESDLSDNDDSDDAFYESSYDFDPVKE